MRPRSILLLLVASCLLGAAPVSVALATPRVDTPGATAQAAGADDGSGDGSSSDDPPGDGDDGDPDVADGPATPGVVTNSAGTTGAGSATDSAGSASSSAARKTYSLDAFLKSGTLDLGATPIAGAGTLTDRLTLAPGAKAKALKPFSTVKLATGRHSTTSAGRVDAPLHLAKRGRKALSQVLNSVTVTVRTDIRLRSGKRTTRTRTIVLKRDA